MKMKEGTDYMVISNNIKEICEDRGLRQYDVAKAIGCNVRTVGRIERGENAPSVEFTLRVSKYFDRDSFYTHVIYSKLII